jgi:nitroimidazol reductase NimA-like FMN-containing flavoprotein (pyridoxamine 5'-phosphate oxidase superfamily)
MTAYAEHLDRAGALALLSNAGVGRVIYTSAAMPAVRPLPFRLAADGRVLLRAPAGSALVRAVGGALVAFEVDEIRQTDGAGWCVTLLGRAVVGAEDPATGDVEIHILPEAVHGDHFAPSGAWTRA